MFSLVPKWICDALTDISPQWLKERGVDVLLMDFDNTIVPYTSDVPSREIENWFMELKNAGLRLCVVSNTKRGRAVQFCRERGIDCITHAKKPFQRGIREAITRFGGDKGRFALVGDQIFTDVLGANCAGITSVLVRPIHLHNFWLQARHVLEKPFIAIGKRRLNRGYGT